MEAIMRWLILIYLLLLAPVPMVRSAEPAGGQIVYSRKEDDRYLLHIMNADGTGDHLLTGTTANVNLFPTWSPDGKRILYASAPSLTGNEVSISIVNADGSGNKVMELPQRPAMFPAWSPDGTKIAYTAGEGMPNVYVIDVGGGAARRLNPAGQAAAAPFWSRDGKRVGYTRLSEGEPKKSEIILAQADGSREEVLVSKPDKIPVAGAGALSPDEKRLLFVVIDPEANKASLRILDMAAKSEQVVRGVTLGTVEGPHQFPNPAWAPDGRSFLITLRDEKGSGVFRLSEDGKTKTRLTPENVDCVGGSWLGSR
jgi:Tol biopolymer transport system component